MLRELIDLFLEGVPERLSQIGRNLGNSEQLAFEAHALKSMSLNMGAKRIVELARKLEEQGRAGSVAEAPALLKELESAFTQTKAHLLPLRES
jgi:HPt (histidine-containing phosphotransfer) domain-containing protein